MPEPTDRPWTAQPAPQPSSGPIIQALVIDDLHARGWARVAHDMHERWDFGCRKYRNDGLRPGDGRNTLADAYEEALDLAVYLRKATVEGLPVHRDYRAVLRQTRRLRHRLDPDRPVPFTAGPLGRRYVARRAAAALADLWFGARHAAAALWWHSRRPRT